ncbi:hypothetical protein HAX54_035779 [Datura stramonium]|uniref:Uncharacterized protein n=1 Tax=Datura stramonium TaxID=4076 RepID=A0ABS8RMD7_DATST|nr:hypothetical protein [Datura stramonium]
MTLQKAEMISCENAMIAKASEEIGGPGSLVLSNNQAVIKKWIGPYGSLRGSIISVTWNKVLDVKKGSKHDGKKTIERRNIMGWEQKQQVEGLRMVLARC